MGRFSRSCSETPKLSLGRPRLASPMKADKAAAEFVTTSKRPTCDARIGGGCGFETLSQS